MEFRYLVISISVLFALALGGESHAQSRVSEEDYWQAVWPKTLIPTALQEFLKPITSGVEIQDHPTKIDDTEYPKLMIQSTRKPFSMSMTFTLAKPSAFMVSLVAADGTQTQALAICHSDTSGMNRQMLHQIMGVDPGTNPVCHFLGTKEILWEPNLAVDTAYQSEVVL